MLIPLLLIMTGVMLSGMLTLLPLEFFVIVPDYFKFLLFILGIVFAVLGYMIYIMRARQTGACHIMEKGRPGRFLWFYFYDDGEMRITPGIRVGEKQSYNREMDNQVPVTKSYHLADHQVLIIPEGVGCAADLDYALYAELLDAKGGFENLRIAREDAFAKIAKGIGLTLSEPKESMAHVVTSGQDIKKVADRITEQRKQRYSPSPPQ
jgi:hypothetical protein